MSDDPFRQLNRYGNRKKNFYLHMGLFGGATIVMFIFNQITEPNNLWTLKISMVWMVVVMLHYFYAFGFILPKEKQIHNHHEENLLNEKLNLKEKEKNYRDSDLV